MDTFMLAAIEEARMGLAEGVVPTGSVLVHAGSILVRGHNRRVQKGSVILHGEMDALENAGRQRASVYRDAVLYTTLSPCAAGDTPYNVTRIEDFPRTFSEFVQ